MANVGGLRRRTKAGHYVPSPPPRLLGGSESHTSLAVYPPTSQFLNPGKNLKSGLRKERAGFTHVGPKPHMDIYKQ